MKKRSILFLCPFFVMSIFVFSVEIENISLQQAFDEGKVGLTFEPVADKNVLVLTVKNQSGTPLAIKVPEGANTLTHSVNFEFDPDKPPQMVTTYVHFYASQVITFELKCDSEFKAIVQQSEKEPLEGTLTIANATPEVTDMHLKEIGVEKNLMAQLGTWQKKVGFLTPSENPVQSLQGLTIEDIAFNESISDEYYRPRIISFLKQLGFQDEQLSQVKIYSACLYNELDKKPAIYITYQSQIPKIAKTIKIQFVEKNNE